MYAEAEGINEKVPGTRSGGIPKSPPAAGAKKGERSEANLLTPTGIPPEKQSHLCGCFFR